MYSHRGSFSAHMSFFQSTPPIKAATSVSLPLYVLLLFQSTPPVGSYASRVSLSTVSAGFQSSSPLRETIQVKIPQTSFGVVSILGWRVGVTPVHYDAAYAAVQPLFQYTLMWAKPLPAIYNMTISHTISKIVQPLNPELLELPCVDIPRYPAECVDNSVTIP